MCIGGRCHSDVDEKDTECAINNVVDYFGNLHLENKYYYMRGLDGFFSSVKGSNRFRILCIGHNQKSLSGIIVPVAINKSSSSILVKWQMIDK